MVPIIEPSFSVLCECPPDPPFTGTPSRALTRSWPGAWVCLPPSAPNPSYAWISGCPGCVAYGSGSNHQTISPARIKRRELEAFAVITFFRRFLPYVGPVGMAAVSACRLLKAPETQWIQPPSPHYRNACPISLSPSHPNTTPPPPRAQSMSQPPRGVITRNARTETSLK